MIQIDNMVAGPGEKKNTWLSIPGSGIKLPVTVICGKEEGPTFLITAGVHGAEYIGIETAMQLSRELRPEEVHGNVIFLLVANPSACKDYVRFLVPEDGKNLNQVFPGDMDGTLSERIAATITDKLQSKADYYIDLHAGDTSEEVMPFVYFTGVAEPEVCKVSEEMASAMDVSIRARSTATTGAYSSACMRGLPAILIERGGGGRFSKEEIQLYKQDIRNILAHFRVLAEEEVHRVEQKEVRQATYIDAEQEGFWYPMYSAGEKFEEGTLLGEIKDVWGERVEAYYAEYDGIVLYQTVGMGIKAGDALIAYGRVM
ncbi:MAG: M14 family metallopeptidase [bacterium]|nr:M14 family metallopeptidase [bacterium]